MTTFVTIACAFVFGASSLMLLTGLSRCVSSDPQHETSQHFAFGWIFGALAMLGLMRFL